MRRVTGTDLTKLMQVQFAVVGFCLFFFLHSHFQLISLDLQESWHFWYIDVILFIFVSI